METVREEEGENAKQSCKERTAQGCGAGEHGVQWELCVFQFWGDYLLWVKETHLSLTKEEGYAVSIQKCLTNPRRGGEASQVLSVAGICHRQASMSWLSVSLGAHSVLSLLHSVSLLQDSLQFLFHSNFFFKHIVETLPSQPHIYTTTNFRDPEESNKSLFYPNPGYCKWKFPWGQMPILNPSYSMWVGKRVKFG